MSQNTVADRILVIDLAGHCIIGVNEEERREKQEVIINLALETDLALPCRSDRFEDTIDYRALKKRILARVEDSDFRLLEALAQAVAEVCLADAMIRRVRVRVEKPGALRFARSVAVEIVRDSQS